MANAYEDFVAKVRGWLNRDAEVISDTVIEESMEFAADKAYKQLQIPVLEANVNYTVIADDEVATSTSQVYLEESNGVRNVVKLPVPGDLTSFIHLRIKSSNSASKEGIVFNEKTDVRTFWDMYADRYTDFFWARQTNFILAAGNISVGDVIELHYYRRLPALNARYDVNAVNFNAGVIDVATSMPGSGVTLYFDNGTIYPPVPFTDTAYSIQNLAGDREEFYFDSEAGQLPDNWFRDDNVQVILFGALEQCFDYLDDQVQAQKYKMKFIEAIEELNREEKKRKASGGNIQVHFNSSLI